MAYDQGLAERVRDVLVARSDIAEMRMFGGLAFLARGSMCCGVMGDALMVRVGSAAREWALEQPHVRPLAQGERQMAGFVCVDPEGCRTEKALTAWVQRGVDFALTLPEKTRR